jgi:hypothetical protein
MLVRGVRPGRAIVAGQGLTKVSGPQGEASHRVLGALGDGLAIEPGSRDALIAQWISKLGAPGGHESAFAAPELAARP